MVNTRSKEKADTGANERTDTSDRPVDSGITTGHLILGQPASPTDPLNEAPVTVIETTERAPRARSERSRISSRTIALRRDAQISAAEKLAEIERRKLEKLAEIEKNLVTKQLEADLQAISDEEKLEDDARKSTDSGSAVRNVAARRTEDWVQGVTRASPPRHLSPAAARGAEMRKREGEAEGGTLEQLTRAMTALASRPEHTMSRLQEYNGAPGEWLSFKASYDEQKDRFSKIENLARLRRCLRGEAKAAVCNQLIGKGDPDQVMKALQSRFGRTECIVEEELQSIRDLPRLSDVPKQIHFFACKVQNSIAALRALEEDEQLRSVDIVKALKAKMAPLMHRWIDYARLRVQDRTPELVKISEFLTEEADCMSSHWRIERWSVPPTPQRPPQPVLRNPTARGAHGNPHYKATAAAHAADTETNCNNATEIKCNFCSAPNHYIWECYKFKKLDVEARRAHVSSTQLCYKCLRKGHRSRMCKIRKSCTVNDCNRHHHTLLHEQREMQQPVQDERDDMKSETAMNAYACRTRALLKVLPVTLHGPRGSTKTYALLDDGSTITLIKSELADRIGATGPREPFSLAGISSTRSVTMSRRINADISGASGEIHHIKNARTVDRLELTAQSIKNFNQLPHLRGVPVETYENAIPEILIGQDNWPLLNAEEVRSNRRDEPVASRTPLGWVLHGGGGGRCKSVRFVEESHFVGRTDIAMLDEQVREYFKLEALGVSTKERARPDDEYALGILNETVRRVNGDSQWEAGLLWRAGVTNMPPSHNSALKRLRTLERKMDADRAFGDAYVAQMEHLINSGYATPTSSAVGAKDWYLPHFAVTNPNKPGKIRIVFDAAARVNGRSLNDALLTGPDLLQPLLGILFKFREGRIAVSADIKEMFLRVQIASDDRRSQRFLWRAYDRTLPPVAYEMRSMIFGAASSPTTAIYVLNRNAREFGANYPEALRAIETRFYMDDFLSSYESTEEALKTCMEVKDITGRGGFQLTSWSSNNVEILKAVDPDGHIGPRNLDLQTTNEKTLGLRWDPRADTLGFNLNMARVPLEIARGEKRPTKRQMLSVTMSVFDPLGLLAPIIIQAKIILQQVWRSNIGWDDELADAEASMWEEWIRRLRVSWTCRVPRCYCEDAAHSEIELHTFCDASEDAYAAVSYFRFVKNDATIHTAIVASKSRVTPLKPVSIPRLELQAALLGSRLAATIVREHDIKPARRFFWSDSSTVLAWIKGDPRQYKTFVSHRLSEIDELTETDEWRWVPTTHNVADDATRRLEGLSPEHRWFHGPEFLRHEESAWPEQQPIRAQESAEDAERKKTEISATATRACTDGHLPDASRFSKWIRLVRTTAAVSLFIEKCRRGRAVELSRRHLDEAEKMLIKKVQNDAFSEEMRCLRTGKPLPRDSRLLRLSLYIDAEGILRLDGRANATAGLSRRTTEPVILCGKHHVTKLLVHHHHVLAHHGSPETVVNCLRERYWIVHLRPTVRAAGRECQICRIRKATAQSPPMGDLPEIRLRHHHRPFTCTGVDYFGPLDIAIGRRREKRYVALFTCLVTRAVHVEIAASLSTDSAISALRRFMARRGAPEVIWSDNGTNFRGADAELRRAWDEVDKEEVKTYALTRGADWRFIPPAAPFMGGAWERLVGSIRRALQATLHQRAPTEEVLATLLAEAEYTVNSRPLTHVSVDPADPEALTPNHFLLGSASGAPTPGAFDESDLARRRQWRATQRLADVFWERWVREYLPTLLPRPSSRDTRPELKMGDLVVIVDATLPRNVWPRGVIERVLPGRDGHVRVVDVRTVGGLLRRPAKKIVRLPVERVVETAADDRGENVDDGPTPTT